LISKRLRALRKERKLLQRDIAKYLNITTSAYGYYEQGKRRADAETIKKLADFFNVSTDYLLGRTDDRKIYNNVDTETNNTKPLDYAKLEEKVIKRFLDEGILVENESISESMFNKVLEYGTETAIEILKLENQIKKISL